MSIDLYSGPLSNNAFNVLDALNTAEKDASLARDQGSGILRSGSRRSSSNEFQSSFSATENHLEYSR